MSSIFFYSYGFLLLYTIALLLKCVIFQSTFFPHLAFCLFPDLCGSFLWWFFAALKVEKMIYDMPEQKQKRKKLCFYKNVWRLVIFIFIYTHAQSDKFDKVNESSAEKMWKDKNVPQRVVLRVLFHFYPLQYNYSMYTWMQFAKPKDGTLFILERKFNTDTLRWQVPLRHNISAYTERSKLTYNQTYLTTTCFSK